MGRESAFVKILETDSLADIALIKSALDDQDVRYFLQGENMKFLRPVDPVLLMVAQEDVDTVLELLKPLKLSYVPFVFGKS
jgi:hypothetical protein